MCELRDLYLVFFQASTQSAGDLSGEKLMNPLAKSVAKANLPTFDPLDLFDFLDFSTFDFLAFTSSAIILPMILVTGATGFIGRSLIRHYSRPGAAWRVFDSFLASFSPASMGVPVEVAVASLSMNAPCAPP